MSGTYRLEPTKMGLRRYWLARGELRDARFEVPDGNLDVSFVQTTMVNVDFSGLKFSTFLAHDSVFQRCDFSRTGFDHVLLGATGYGAYKWDERSWPVTVFRKCVFARTRLPAEAYFGNARFERCVFDGARLRGQNSTAQAQFVGCTFRGKIQDMTFWGTPRHDSTVLGRDRNAFTGNDFTATELLDVSFRHIDIQAQEFPGPPDYAVLDRVDRRVAAVVAIMADWPDDEIKTVAARSLKLHADWAIEYNNGYALVSRNWVNRRLPPEVREQIFQLLVAYSEDQQ